MTCVTFLVSFGANIWALDNDFHTPLDVAVLQDHKDVIRYLDAVVAKQTILNKKLVKKMKEKALVEAQKRVRKYEKMQEKANKRAELQDKKLAREREKMGVVGTIEPDGYDSGHSTMKSSKFSTSSASSKTSLTELKPYSAYFNQGKKGNVLGGVAKKIKQKQKNGSIDVMGEFKVCEQEMDGTKTIRSLSGLQRDAQILYVKSENQKNDRSNGNHDDAISRAVSEPDFNYSGDSGVDSGESPEACSMFERPGFGSVAFMRRHGTSGVLMSFPSDSTDDDTNSGDTGDNGPGPSGTNRRRHGGRRGSFSDSIGTIGSLATRMRSMPWDDDELDQLDDELTESTPLELFLAANGVSEFLSLFYQEKIDLPALMLLSDSDLKEIGLPMGPRRKIMEAILKRREIITCPGTITDIRL